MSPPDLSKPFGLSKPLSRRRGPPVLLLLTEMFDLIARQDADCADGNKDDRIEATLLIPRQQAKPNQTVKSRRETALIRLCDTYKRFGSSPIDRIPRHGQIACLGSDLNQNSSLHRMSQHRAS